MRATLLAIGLALVSAGALRADEDLAKLTKDAKAKDAKTRLKAVEGLSALGEDAAKPLCDAMLDTDSKVATAALVGLEKVHPKLYKPLSAVILEGSDSKRADALRALGELGNQGRPALSLVIARAKAEIGKIPVGKGAGAGRSTPLASVYLQTAGLIGGDDQECVAFFKAVAVSPYTTLRRESFDWLLLWAGDKDERRKEVLPVIRSQLADNTFAIPYIRAAGTYGALSKDLLPALKQLKLSKTAGVRDEATRAVGEIEKP